MSFHFQLAKETYKFSCAHFTIFGPKQAELLHGHNYRVRFQIQVEQLNPSTGLCFDLADAKPLLQKVCNGLDETILIPSESPYLTLAEDRSNIMVTFAEKKYSFPRADVKLLPIANVSIEELSRYLYRRLLPDLKKICEIDNLVVTVEETAGQSVSFTEP